MVELIAPVIGRLGYLGVMLLMFVETLIPPIPSEVIMPLVGVAAARGEIGIAGAIVAAVIGSTAGATAWYGIARAFGPDRLVALAERYGRWLGLSPAIVERATAWFARKGGFAVFLARILPGVRVYISVPAGLSRMPFGAFLAWTVAGFTVWYGFLGVAGFALAEWLDPSILLLLELLGFLLVLPALRRRRVAAPQPSNLIRQDISRFLSAASRNNGQAVRRHH